MTNKYIALLRSVKKHEKEVAAIRDKIRKTLGDLGDLDQSCEEAVESLRRAADSLSELV